MVESNFPLLEYELDFVTCSKKGEGFSGTTIKDTWTKPRRGGIRGGKWGWLGWEGIGGGIQTTVVEQQ